MAGKMRVNNFNVDGYYVIPTKGETTYHHQHTPMTLEQMQGIVGGDIELVPRRNKHVQVYCNEEGKILGLPMNVDATSFTLEHTELRGDIIQGPLLVVCGKARAS